MEKFKQRKRTLKIRKISETIGYANKEIKYSKLCEDVMIWEGTIYAPRGARRILNKTKTKIKTNNKIIKKAPLHLTLKNYYSKETFKKLKN